MVVAAAVAAPPDERPVWKEYKTDSGKKYFYNRVTKERTWKRPPELKADAGSGSSSSSCSSSGTESGQTAPARSPPTASPKSAFFPRRSQFDGDGQAPRASKLALYAYYAASLEDPPAKGSKTDADSDSGRPPSDSGDTGASGGRNGWVQDEEGYWVRAERHSHATRSPRTRTRL